MGTKWTLIRHRFTFQSLLNSSSAGLLATSFQEKNRGRLKVWGRASQRLTGCLSVLEDPFPMLNFTLGTLALSSSMLMITLTETRKGKILVSKLCARMPSERWRAGKTRHSYLTMKKREKKTSLLLPEWWLGRKSSVSNSLGQSNWTRGSFSHKKDSSL